MTAREAPEAPERARLSGAERRQRILDVALERFGVGGYGAASMVEIAAAAGVTKPVVYQHFVSKRALFLEVLTDCGQRMVAAIEKATADASTPREQVASGFDAFVQFFADHPPAFRVLFSEANRADDEFAAEVARVERVMADRIASLLTIDDLGDAGRRLVAHGIIGLAEGAVRFWMESETPDPPGSLDAGRVADLLTTVTWAGLRGER